MPAASYRVLSRFFEKNLNFTPTPADVAQFEKDLAVVSPALMRDALVELSQGRSRNQPAVAGQWRTAIYAIYNRKIAEHAQLFPLFHCFETAFRSKIAVTLEEHYGIAAWWGPLNSALRSGGDHTSVTTIGHVKSVPFDQRRAIFKMVEGLTNNNVNVMSFADGYELLQHSTLGQIRRLLHSHWSLFRGSFKTPTGQPMKQQVAFDKFDSVQDGRNAVYHHLPFAGMTDVYNNANELLACLPFPLPRVHKVIANSKCAPPPYF